MEKKLRKKVSVLLLLFLTGSFIHAQKTVTGTVSDDGGPLPGVTVLVKGTQTNASTDFDGKYSIEVTEGEVLVFSYVGLTTKEVTVGSDNIIDVTMQGDNALDEVVVTAFGVKRQKKSLGYATTTITSDDLTEVSASNPFESLSGKIAGVDITAPAQNGASTKVIMRGFSSLSNNSPLYIVDGSPINNSANSSVDGGVSRSYDGGTGINDLDPNNIASMTVLKGATAAAIYGSRASNGAIIITTKSGKAGKIKVELTSSYDLMEVSRVPHLQQEFGQGWAGSSSSANYLGGLGTSNENGSWGPAFDGEDRLWGVVANNQQQYKPYSNLENNIEDFYETGSSFNNSIRVSGGSDKATFSVSASQSDADGVIPTNADTYNKKTFNASGSVNNDKFSARAVVNFVVKDHNIVNTGQGSPSGGNTMMQELLQIPRDISVVDMKDYTNNVYNTNSYFYTPYSTNPYFTIDNNSMTIKTNRVYGNINLGYEILPELRVSVQIGADITNRDLKSHGAIINYDEGSPQEVFSSQTIVGAVSESKLVRKEYDIFSNLNYDKEFGEDFSLSAAIGFNYNERSTDFLGVSVTDLDVEGFYELKNSAVTPTVTQNNTLRRGYAAYGTGTLGYKDKYFVTVTGRNDWSSTLSLNNNSFFYPSMSLSVVAVDSGDSFLKLRLGMAEVAKDTGVYNTSSTMISGIAGAYFGTINLPIGGVNGFELGTSLGNANIKPETTKEVEVGFELGLFKRRLNVDLSLYNKDTEGVIISRDLPTSTGYTSVVGNYFDLNNKGIELSISGTPIQTDDFKWEVSYTFTKNVNKVENVAEGLGKMAINSSYGVFMYAEEGKSLGVFRALKPKTNDKGQYIVNPNTGVYEVGDEAEEIGSMQRDFSMGLKNTFKYKGFKLAFSLDWKQGGDMYSYTKRLLGFTGNSIQTTYNDRNTFIIPNSVVEDAPGVYSENTTAVAFDEITSFYASSSMDATHVIDKTFVRLRDLSLSYSFPKEWVNKMKLDYLSLSVYGKNLYMWTPDENPYVDPEISSFGGADLSSEFGEFAGNPAQRTYGVSLKLNF
ncbi:MAG: SusC/RagA family TonB-linked outer membrane protein [Flavobacteriaceae bacterium]|nr:SusC/RagA family TonB-linked outer membrane protein [Flavobacteriaceae bacterium]